MFSPRRLFALWLVLQPCLAFAITPTELGAVGDGKADDTAALQRALDAAPATIELANKTYRLTEPLYISSETTILGPGVLATDTTASVILNRPGDKPHRNIRLEGFEIRKRYIPSGIAYGIFIDHAENVTVRDVEISGLHGGAGIRIERTEGFEISGCYIHDFKGTWVKHGAEALGISPRESRRGRIVNNRIENITVTEESADAANYQTDGMEPHTCEHLLIANNTIYNVGEGIDLVHCRSSVVQGNVIDKCWHFGIKVIHGTRFTTITGNSISRAALAGMSLYYGNIDLGTEYGNVVSGNTIANVGAIKRADDKTTYGTWLNWDFAGIELVNDNRPGNAVYDFVVANNVIYDDQTSPTCKYGIIERYVSYEADGTPKFLHRPVADDSPYENQISGNLVRGMRTADYLLRSKMKE